MKYFTVISFLIFQGTLLAQNQVVEAEYYIQDDPGFGNATPIDLTSAETISESFAASTDGLSAGNYFAYVRVKDSNEMWSIPLKVRFQIQRADLPDITAVEWYAETDPGFGNANGIDIIAGATVEGDYLASTSGFEEGRTFTYLRCQNEDGAWSIPLKVPFQVQRPDLPEITGAEWYLAEDPGFGNANPLEIEPDETVQGVQLASTEDLPAGRNFAYMRFQNADGTWSVPLKQGFMINDKFPLDVVAAEYFIDEDPGIGLGNPVSVDSDHFVSESFLAEVTADLELGDHFLYTRVKNEEDTWSINLVKIFNVGTVSTEDEKLVKAVTVFPNPSRGPISIISENLSILSVQIFNVQSRLVEQYQNNFKRLEIDGLARGTYLFRITTENGSLTKAVVIQ